MTAALRRHLPGLVLCAVLAWLFAHYVGYHPRHWGIAALLLSVYAAVALRRGQMPHPSTNAGLAIALGVVMVVWTALSLLWADYSRHLALEETGRTLLYLLGFAAGACAYARTRDLVRGVAWMGWLLGAVVLVTAVRVTTLADPLTLFAGGRLDWPVGYSNGVHALCLIAAWLLIGMSASIEQRHSIGDHAILTASTSALAMGGATLAACLGAMAQSRGGLLATLVALLVALVAFARPGALGWRVGLVVAATLVAAPWLGKTYRTQQKLVDAEYFHTGVGVARDAAIAAAHSAGTAALAAAAAVTLTVLALTLVLVEMRLQRPHPSRYASPAPLAAFVGCIVLLIVVAGALDGRALTWGQQQWHSCRNPTEQPRTAKEVDSHLLEVGTNRCDFYRVALNSVSDSPMLGVGANNFQGAYVHGRRSHESPRQVHSLPLQLLSELGIIGALIGAAFAVTVIHAGIRFIRSGPLRDPAIAGAVVAITQWGVHSSIDWIWNLPAITLVVAVLAGGLVSSMNPPDEFIRHRTVLPAMVVVLAATLVVCVPLVAGDMLTRTALLPKTSHQDALRAAERAEQLDPLWAKPPLIQAQLLAKYGTKQDAADAARRAIDAEPANWAVLWQAAAILQPVDRIAAKKARATAVSLNPQARKLKDPLHDPAQLFAGSDSDDRPGAVAVSIG